MGSIFVSSFTVTQEEFFLFHKIERDLYRILVIHLFREPAECMQIFGMWLWLERIGFRNMVKKILSLPNLLINEVADEMLLCLSCMNSGIITPSTDGNDIPLLQSLMNKENSFQFFYENRVPTLQGVAKVNNEEPADDRTLFVTFSKGYHVEEWEVREFFTMTYGDCVESLQMQEIVQPNEQPLFARIVFHRVCNIDMILRGATKVKFTINGKHVWARKFVPKRTTTTKSFLPSLPNLPSASGI
ncbi:hypothetical protein SESBI_45819 [Sesbania bispinosa]|nr:hypothetical protein SESBI_45819 [Sesbania bispinosa]